nr:MAG TPA: hypothetical protein [Caudoviricetes sp.]
MNDIFSTIHPMRLSQNSTMYGEKTRLKAYQRASLIMQ